MAVAQVGGVVEEELVVGAAVQVDGDGPLGVDAGGRRVDGELAHRDVRAVDPPVPDAQDLLGVGDHEQVDVVGAQAELLEGGAHVLDTVDRQVDGPGAPVVPAPLPNGLPHGGVVDDREQLGQVVGQETVVEHLVAVVELVEEDVLVQVGGKGAQLGVGAGGLLVQGLHGRGEAADQAQATALLEREGGTAVGQGVGNDGRLGAHVLSRGGAGDVRDVSQLTPTA